MGGIGDAGSRDLQISFLFLDPKIQLRLNQKHFCFPLFYPPRRKKYNDMRVLILLALIACVSAGVPQLLVKIIQTFSAENCQSVDMIGEYREVKE